MMSWPSACAASIRQDRTATPSQITVQAPQTPCSQPTWVPASSRSWRRKSLSSSRDSTVREYDVPFTMRVMSWLSVVTARSLVRNRQGASGQDAGEMPLEFFAGVDIAARIDGALNQFSRLIDRGCADRVAGQRRAGFLSQDRRFAGIAKSDPR